MSREVVRKHVDAWLIRARRDLAAAELGLSAEPPLLDDVAFHAQQAAEKALKGLLTDNDLIFTKTHVIGELAPALLGVDREMEPLLRRASRLSPYAWRYRYPGDAEEPPLAEAVEALEIAREVVAAVDARIGA